jgi:hypothetical protein
MTLEEINEMFGTAFTLGCEVMVERDGKTPHVGMVVGTDDCFLKLKLDHHDVVCMFDYYPPECQIIG